MGVGEMFSAVRCRVSVIVTLEDQCEGKRMFQRLGRDCSVQVLHLSHLHTLTVVHCL